jgi:hypothetical protein
MEHVDMRKLPAAAQEERRRQGVGLRESDLNYEAIATQTGLSRTGVFDICRRFAGHGMAGLRSGPRGPASGSGRFLNAAQEGGAHPDLPAYSGRIGAAVCVGEGRALIEQRCGVRLAVRTMGKELLGALGLHRPEAATARL